MNLNIVLTAFLFATALTPDISEVRESYREAASSEDMAKQLHKDLSGITKEEDKVLLAYKGAVTTLLANYANTIKEKKAYFKEGVGYLEYAVEKSPKNIEIRFIRLSVKENAPKITGYKKNLDQDKGFILEHLSKVENSEVKKYIKGYISESKVFTESEKQSVLQN